MLLLQGWKSQFSSSHPSRAAALVAMEGRLYPSAEFQTQNHSEHFIASNSTGHSALAPQVLLHDAVKPSVPHWFLSHSWSHGTW